MEPQPNCQWEGCLILAAHVIAYDNVTLTVCGRHFDLWVSA